MLHVRHAVHSRPGALLVQPLHGARDLGRFVADALDVRDGLRDAGDHAQVASGGLPTRDHVDHHLVELEFEVVHAAVGVDRLLRELHVLLLERRQRGPHLGLDQAAHVQDARAYRLEFLVVLPH